MTADGARQASERQAPDRQASERRGRRAEVRAAWLLRLKGYRILARRFRAPGGEIDLVAERWRTVAFVEVKHRPTLAEALESVHPASRARIVRAARAWLAAHPPPPGTTLRFDVIAGAPGTLPRHLPAAFDAGDDAW